MPTVRKYKRAKPPRLGVLEVKALVRHRDGYRCTECGMTARRHVKIYGRTLEVHRLVPGSRYTVRGCVSLCTRCHGPQPRSARGRSPNFRPRLPRELVLMARSVAVSQGLTLAEYLSDLLRPLVDRDLAKHQQEDQRRERRAKKTDKPPAD